MESFTDSLNKLAATSKGVAQLLLAIGENRLELLSVEVQLELQRLIRMMLLVLGISTFGLLAVMSLTASLVFLLKAYPPAAVLLVLASLYAAIGAFLYSRLTRLLRNWQVFSATLDQIRKDRASQESMPS
jgi:uncharacterized membrane protein YqjE